MDASTLEPDNLEEILMELNKFEKRLSENSEKTAALTPVLEEYLNFVAKTGATHFPWPKIKGLFRVKLEMVIDEFHAFSPADNVPPVPNVDAFSFTACREKVFQQLECFCGVPFTVQRLCELLTAPRRHYKRSDKFMRALEKNMLIVSTVDPKAGTFAAPPRRDSNVSASKEGPSSDFMMNGDHEEEDEERGEPEKKYARLSPASSSSTSPVRSPKSTTSSTAVNRNSESSEDMDVDDDPSPTQAANGPCDSHDSESPSAQPNAANSAASQPSKDGEPSDDTLMPAKAGDDEGGPCDSRDTSMDDEDGASSNQKSLDAASSSGMAASTKDREGEEQQQPSAAASDEAESRTNEISDASSEATPDREGPCDSGEVDMADASQASPSSSGASNAAVNSTADQTPSNNEAESTGEEGPEAESGSTDTAAQKAASERESGATSGQQETTGETQTAATTSSSSSGEAQAAAAETNS